MLPIFKAFINKRKPPTFTTAANIVDHQKVKSVTAQPDHNNIKTKYGREKRVKPTEASAGLILLKAFFDTV